MQKPLTYQGTIVPWTTPWTGEEHDVRVEPSHLAGGGWVLTQRSAPGVGRPIFGSQHPHRQRRAVLQGLCDVCGLQIRQHEPRVLTHPGTPLKGTTEIGHVMAPSHRECARQAALVCPWMQKQISDGTLSVTIAKRFKLALAVLDPEVVETEIGEPFGFQVFGHAKLIVTKGLKRDADWLMMETS